MEILYTKNPTEIINTDFKFGFVLTKVVIEYPKLGFPTVKITYKTNNPAINLVENGMSDEVCFVVPMDKQEILSVLPSMVNTSIVETIKFLLERQPDLLNAKYIMEQMPTSLYSNMSATKDIMNYLPRNGKIQEYIKPIMQKKKVLIDDYKAKQLEKAEKARESLTALIDEYQQTFNKN